MSINLMSRFFFRKDLTTHEIAIGIAMADWTDQIGRCWAAVSTLAEKVNCSPRAVQNALRRFQELGIVKVVNRENRSSIYYLQIEGLPEAERPRRPKELAPGETGERRAPVGAGTGAPHSMTGAPHTGTGAGGAPRYVSDTLEIPESAQKPDLDLLGEPIRSPEQIQADEESALLDYVATRWKKLVADNDGRIADIRTISDQRRTAILARGDRKAWEEVFEQIDASRWLRGLSKPGRGYDQPMTITMAWILTPANFDNTLEGNHRDKRDLNASFDASTGRNLTPVEQASRNVSALIREGRARGGFGRNRGGADAGVPQLVDGRASRD